MKPLSEQPGIPTRTLPARRRKIGPSAGSGDPAYRTSPRRWSEVGHSRDLPSSTQSGSVLVIVLWISFGLVTLALYFGQSMSFELRAADNRVASIEAEQAIAGAVRYVSNILATAEYPGTLPDPQLYRREAVPVGEATFWLLGRNDLQTVVDQPYFNLVDEGSKLNVNTATIEMLELLPRMTPELAAAIVDWRDADSNVSAGGAEDEIYQRLNPAYRCKNAKFDTIAELRLVYGMDLDLLYGEDANLNGVLDLNENDGDQSFPLDNKDGRLDPGLFEYLTVYTQAPTSRTNGAARINVASTNQQELATLLMEKFDTTRANEILARLGFQLGGGGGGAGGGGGGRGGGGGGAGAMTPVRSVLEFYMRSEMTPADFALIESDITATTNSVALVNVNTASEMVLSCVPGIGIQNAPSLVAYRRSNRTSLISNPSLAWVADVLTQTNALQAGPYLTGHSYQFTADIAAVGHYGRGYQRVKFVFDTSQGIPRIVFRQDLTSLGWALGRDVRNSLPLLARTKL